MKRNVYFKKIVLTISGAENFTFKIGNNRVVKNIFSKKISHNLLKYNHFLKIGKKC